MNNVLIIGCGDIGGRIARRALAEGVAAAALVRNSEQAETLERSGIHSFVADLNVPQPQLKLPSAGRDLFYFVPPPGGGHSDPRVHHLLAGIKPGEEPASIVYVSTSGVYGEGSEIPVTEEAPTAPATARARRRLDAEEALRAWGAERNIPVAVLRVCAIYGPGRLPIFHIRQGHPLLSEDEGRLTCRVHAEDLARACLAAAGQNEVFNVSDREPTTMTRYFEAVAELHQLPCPPRVSLAEARRVMKPLLLTYFTEARVLSNEKLLQGLNFSLLYPTLREGLAVSRETAPAES